MPYTEKDLIRATKEVTAIMTTLHDTISKTAERCGVYLGISDELNDAPENGSKYMLGVENAMAMLDMSYGQLRKALQAIPKPYR